MHPLDVLAYNEVAYVEARIAWLAKMRAEKDATAERKRMVEEFARWAESYEAAWSRQSETNRVFGPEIRIFFDCWSYRVDWDDNKIYRKLISQSEDLAKAAVKKTGIDRVRALRDSLVKHIEAQLILWRHAL